MKFRALALGLFGLLHPSVARAEAYQFSRVELRSLGCAIDGLGDAELRAALASELSASSLALAPAEEPLAANSVMVTVRLPCAPLTDLGLNANFAGIAFERVVKLDELPRASRARALALVLAELLTEFAEPELADAAPAGPTATAAAPVAAKPPEAAPPKVPEKRRKRAAARQPETSAPSRADDDDVAELRHARRGTFEAPPRFGAGPELRAFFSGPSLLGGRLHADWAAFTVGIGVLARDSAVSSGMLSALIAQGTGAVRLFTLGRADRTSLSLGPRIGLGYVTVTAQPTVPNVEARAVQEPYIDAAAFAEFGFHPLSGFRGGIMTELGYARGVVAMSDSTDVASYGGFFASALFDVALEL